MSLNITAELEWKGKVYELKYSFDVARRLRAEGVNIIGVYREINRDPGCAIDYGDDIAYTIAWLLRQAGAQVTDEEVWRDALQSEATLRQCFGLFNWVCEQHLATSPMAPRPAQQAATKKAKAPRKKRST